MPERYFFEGFPDDPSQPPPPLLQLFPHGGYVVHFREGERLRLPREQFSREHLFMLTFSASAALGGQPVRCSGFMPGVSLRITAGPYAAHVSGAEGETLVFNLCATIFPRLFERWQVDPHNDSLLGITLSGVANTVEFARDAQRITHPGVMQIDVID